MHAHIIGEVDSLGYLYCAECHPEAINASQEGYPAAVWSDSDDGGDPCELCRRPIGRQSDARDVEPPCNDPRPDPRTHPEYWTE